MTVDPSELLAIAEVVAEAAGTLLIEERPVALRVDSKSSPTDAVTEMDRRAETLITTMLADLRPGDGLLGEEGASSPSQSGVRWIVDPLDGTVNYLYGLPLWAVSVAAEVEGEVAAGVVDVPALGRRYVASRGAGARCFVGGQTRSIGVSSVQDLGMALVGTGFGYSGQRRAAQAARVATLLPMVRDIRRLGSAALDLCLVAHGEIDAYYESGLNPWDYAAGALIAHEAGARVRGGDGDWPDATMAFAAAPGIESALWRALSVGPGDSAVAT